MANFFKEYQAGVRAKREQESREKREQEQKRNEIQNYIDSLKVGQKVKYSFLVDSKGNKVVYVGYFISDGSTHIWISKTKDGAKKRQGNTISKESIIF